MDMFSIFAATLQHISLIILLDVWLTGYASLYFNVFLASLSVTVAEMRHDNDFRAAHVTCKRWAGKW